MVMVRRRPQLIAALLVAIAIATAAGGCGSSSSTSGTGTVTTGSVHFAKTKFVLHAGLAFGAFHRYIYKPYKAGSFSPPLSHKAALVKAGLAAAFAYHEVKIALTDARSSPLLSKLLSPLLALQTKLQTMTGRLKGGSLDAADINSANGDVSSIGAASASSGAPVHDLATPALGG